MLMLLDFMSRGKTTLINISEVFWLFTVSVMFGHPTNTGAKPRLPSNKQNHFYIDIWYSWLHLLVKIQIDYKSSSSVNSLKVTQPLGCALCTERIPVRDGRASHHPEHLIMKLRIIFAFFFFLIYKVDHLHDTNFKQLSSPVTDGSVYIDESAKSVGEIISAFQS